MRTTFCLIAVAALFALALAQTRELPRRADDNAILGNRGRSIAKDPLQNVRFAFEGTYGRLTHLVDPKSFQLSLVAYIPSISRPF